MPQTSADGDHHQVAQELAWLGIGHSRLEKMSRFALTNLCGLMFGALTVLSMLPVSFPDKRAALLGAFFNRFAIGLVIVLIDIPCSGWLIGLTVGILLSLPPAIITKIFAPILGIGAIGGLIIWTDSNEIRRLIRQDHGAERGLRSKQRLVPADD